MPLTHFCRPCPGQSNFSKKQLASSALVSRPDSCDSNCILESKYQSILAHGIFTASIYALTLILQDPAETHC